MLNMLAICPAAKVSTARTLSVLKILRKMGIYEKMIFYTKMIVFSEYLKFSIVSQNNGLPLTQSCKFHFRRGKRHTDVARKRGQPFKRLKLPR